MATCNFCGGPAKEIQRCPRCDGCRDAAPPVLTEEDKQTLESAETALAFAHGAIHEVVNHQSVRPDFLRNAMRILKRDRKALRQLIDRLTTGGEGGSRG